MSPVSKLGEMTSTGLFQKHCQVRASYKITRNVQSSWNARLVYVWIKLLHGLPHQGLAVKQHNKHKCPMRQRNVRGKKMKKNLS